MEQETAASAPAREGSAIRRVLRRAIRRKKPPPSSTGDPAHKITSLADTAMTVSGNLKQIKKPCYLIDPRHTKWLSMWDSITGLARRRATKVGRAQDGLWSPAAPFCSRCAHAYL